MKANINEDGYLVLSDIHTGVKIVSTKHYQKLLAQIKSLQEENESLQKHNESLWQQLEESKKSKQDIFDRASEMIDSQGKTISNLSVEVNIYKQQLYEERDYSDSLLVGIGQLYERLDSVRRAHYIQGFADGAWCCKNREMPKEAQKLINDTKSFGSLLEDALESLTQLIKHKK